MLTKRRARNLIKTGYEQTAKVSCLIELNFIE